MQTVSPTGSAVSPNDSGHIPVFLLQLKKDGFADATIRCYGSDLRILAKNCELSNPESVKEWIANAKLTTTRKWSFVKEYGKYAAFCEIPFKKPKYKVEEKIPFIPTEKEVRAIIDATENLREKTTFELLYEIGARIGEVHHLTSKDFDFERRIVIITAEKGGNNREVKISDKLCDLVRQTLEKCGDMPFPGQNAAMLYLWKIRKRLAREQNNPRFHQIHLHTFRHYRATMSYHQTKDILKVKKLLGHKAIESTMVYTQLIELDDSNVHQYTLKEANTKEERNSLIESGWEFVMFDQKEQSYVFRKRTNLLS